MDQLQLYSDQELVKKANSGDKKAAEELYRRYIGLIRKNAYQQHLLAEKSDVEAHLTLTFLEAIKQYDENLHIPFAGFVQSRIHFGAWNTFKHLRRRWQHEMDLLITDGPDNSEIESKFFCDLFNLEEEVISRDQRKALKKAMRVLTINEKLILKAHYEEDKNFATIATEKGCSRQAIRYAYLRAIQKLKKALEN